MVARSFLVGIKRRGILFRKCIDVSHNWSMLMHRFHSRQFRLGIIFPLKGDGLRHCTWFLLRQETGRWTSSHTLSLQCHGLLWRSLLWPREVKSYFCQKVKSRNPNLTRRSLITFDWGGNSCYTTARHWSWRVTHRIFCLKICNWTVFRSSNFLKSGININRLKPPFLHCWSLHLRNYPKLSKLEV